MKILKIELQNINSLKSDTSIVIDFEKEQFKDVGLYAITGSTGAGKTTILDAITIALYHNVPRFKGAKASLIDVVSHNANSAFSRVTFENDAVVYEAFWGIRVADKNGKKYKSPKEEVSLKNLTSGSILATQKRNLITEVAKVTQLDYTQFLRSVMLAQGDFASFLTAKGPDKGKLLEQITGEQIYKKIGQGIFDRKSEEEKKLEKIQAKINDTDVLEEEAKANLKEKDKTLDAHIAKTETAIKAMQFTVNWYAKNEELTNTTKTLEEQAKGITAYAEKNKSVLNLLALNEKAIPFKEHLQNFNRTEKEYLENSEELKKLETELAEIKPSITSITKRVKDEENTVTLANKEFTNWLPKFDLITKLDNQLKNETENQQKAQAQLVEVNSLINSLEKEEKQLSENIKTTENTLKAATDFLIKNESLKAVDVEIYNWTRDLTTLKANRKSLKEDTDFINKQQEIISNTTTLLEKDTALLNTKTTAINLVEKELEVVKNQLEKNNIKTIIAEKDKWTLTVNNWHTFKNISAQTLKVIEEQRIKSAQKKELILELETLTKNSSVVKKQIENQEKSLADASKILELEKSVAKYENDRKNLLKGEPCGLCGSKEHPFAENLKTISVSTAELELQKREKELKISIENKNEFEKKEVQLTTAITGLTNQLSTFNEELKTFKTTSDALKINCELTDVATINKTLNSAIEQLKTLDANLKEAQKLEIQKNEISENIKTQNAAINTLKTTIATRNETIKNTSSVIASNQKLISELTENCIVLENNLKEELAKFKYKLPLIEEIDAFIQSIEKSISNYNKAQEKATTLKTEVTVLKTKFNNTTKQLEVQNTSKKEALKRIENSTIITNKLKLERTTILPISDSVESKRTALQATIKKLTTIFELSEKELQKQLNTKTEKEALKVKVLKEKETIQKTLAVLNTTLNSVLKTSDFETIKAAENALLSDILVSEYIEIQKNLERNQIKLKTKQEENLKAITTLNASKNFTTTAAESKLAFETLNNQKTEFSKEKGKIAEAFRKDQEIRDRNKEIYKKIDAQAKICAVWKELFKIIGNSKDAFNVYVQRLTLKHLLDLANVHLYKLNKRYSLKMEDSYKPKEELNFNLIDHYQTDQVRLVDTSSGGEKFIISLALALGLSDLASKNVKIDSLFIDEGFGTLDSNTLETVIATLETLQAQGKMIGIISHVENLKERIATQIQITKKSNGVSVVNIV